jgi:tetratricopeptide (TPR) repeat protein
MWNYLRVACAALTLSMAVASGPHALAAELHPDLVEAENAFVANDLNASDAALKRRIAEDPNDVEALWRQARNLYQRGEILAQQGATPEQRMKMYREAQIKAQRIQALDPNHPQGWFWEGTALGRIATAQGILQSLFIADDIERLWLKSSNMKGYEYRSSNDAASFPGDVYFALGQFYRLCPDWTIVKMFIGTKGDIDESIRWHRKGVAFSPSRPEMSKELGVSLLCKANREDDAGALAEGKKWLNKAMAMPSQKTTDDIDKTQIPIILSRADDACGYSRDGWQEVSREAYDQSKQ